MTTLEIILTIILYLIVGLWICYKAKWYKDYTGSQSFLIVLTLLLMPFFLLISLIAEYIYRDWDNN